MNVGISATQSSMETSFEEIIQSKLFCTYQMLLFGVATAVVSSLPPAGLQVPDLLRLRRGEYVKIAV